MRFYRFDTPQYLSDQAHNRANPIWDAGSPCIPGIICSVCKNTWGGYRALYLPVNNAALLERLTPWPKPEVEWVQLVDEVKKSLGAQDDIDLMPGDKLVEPVYELRNNRFFDLMKPFPGRWVVTEKVLNLLEEGKFTGFKAVKIKSFWSKGVKDKEQKQPVLFEIVITGKAWRKGFDLEKITDCSHCGRREFPNPHFLEIDESRWDGSDFFNPDTNENIVIITERVSHALYNAGIGNFRCELVSAAES